MLAFAKEISKPGGLGVEVTAFYHDLAPEENVVFKQQREGGNQQDRVESVLHSFTERTELCSGTFHGTGRTGELSSHDVLIGRYFRYQPHITQRYPLEIEYCWVNLLG